MVERCNNCGAELYAGQQFCRRCGAALRAQGEEAPTQLFPHPTTASGANEASAHGAQTGPASAGTLPLGAATTDAVGPHRATGYQPPLAAFQQTSPLAQPQPRRGGRRAVWVIALLAVAVVSAIVTAVVMLIVASDERRPSTVIVKKRSGVAGVEVPHPPVAPDLPKQIRDAVATAGAPLPLDETGAVVSGSETIITKTYNLGDDKLFSLRGLSGDISVEGWDSGEAQVKVIKRGGSAEERRGVSVLASEQEDALTLLSTAGRKGPVKVAYEVKLPRALRQIEIATEESDVKLSGLEGTIVVDVRAGRLEFRDVTGSVRSRLTKGNTKVVYGQAERSGAQEFTAVRGNVEVEFGGEPSAELKAETMDGRISADEELGLTIQKMPAGSHAVGRIGEGNEPLLIKVVNGDIKLKK